MSAAVAASAIEAAEAKPAVAATPAPAAKKPEPAAAAEPKGEEKPKAKPEPVAADPKEARESTIAKFAKRMNAEAEKDGVAVDAPPEERRAKPGPKPGSKHEPKPKPTPAPEPPATKPDAVPAPLPEPEEPATEDDDADDGSTPEPRSVHQLKAKARLRHGDIEKAVKIAFGDLKPEEFQATKEALARKLGVSSKEWADFRRFQSTEKAKVQEFAAKATQLSQRLQADFGPMIKARKAYEAGNYPEAFQHAFGEDINTFQRKAIHQHLSADPEKARLQQQIDELKSKLTKPAEQPAPDPRQQHEAAMKRLEASTHEALVNGDDGEIAHYARKPAFVRRVVELRGEHYDPQTRTTIPLHVAADMARQELKRGMDEWRYEPASGAAAPSSETPGLAGNEPVRTGATRARSPLPSQAAQAGGSTRSLSRQERIAAYAARMG